MMSKNLFTRTKAVLLETAQELIFGFDTAHPERVQPQYRPPEPVQEKTVIERAIAERKQQVRAMLSREEPSRDKECGQ